MTRSCYRLVTMTLVLTGLVLMGLPTGLRAERPAHYPFDVKIGGQMAVLDGQPTSTFAVIEEPVAADATFEVDLEVGKNEYVIINAFPLADDANPVPGAAPKIIMLQGTDEGDLSATTDGSSLEPGVYGLNVVGGGKTSRVRITVE